MSPSTDVKVHCWPKAFQGKFSLVKSQVGSSGLDPHCSESYMTSATRQGR
jgi:hypothetical protein